MTNVNNNAPRFPVISRQDSARDKLVKTVKSFLPSKAFEETNPFNASDETNWSNEQAKFMVQLTTPAPPTHLENKTARLTDPTSPFKVISSRKKLSERAHTYDGQKRKIETKKPLLSTSEKKIPAPKPLRNDWENKSNAAPPELVETKTPRPPENLNGGTETPEPAPSPMTPTREFTTLDYTNIPDGTINKAALASPSNLLDVKAVDNELAFSPPSNYHKPLQDYLGRFDGISDADKFILARLALDELERPPASALTTADIAGAIEVSLGMAEAYGAKLPPPEEFALAHQLESLRGKLGEDNVVDDLIAKAREILFTSPVSPEVAVEQAISEHTNPFLKLTIEVPPSPSFSSSITLDQFDSTLEKHGVYGDRALRSKARVELYEYLRRAPGAQVSPKVDEIVSRHLEAKRHQELSEALLNSLREKYPELNDERVFSQAFTNLVWQMPLPDDSRNEIIAKCIASAARTTAIEYREFGN